MPSAHDQHHERNRPPHDPAREGARVPFEIKGIGQLDEVEAPPLCDDRAVPYQETPAQTRALGRFYWRALRLILQAAISSAVIAVVVLTLWYSVVFIANTYGG